MKNKILDLVTRYWKFDSDQQPTSSWNDKQDLLKEIEKIQLEDLADIRNKLGPINNLLAMLTDISKNNELNVKGSVYDIIISEIKKSKESVEYISKRASENGDNK